MNDSDKCPKCNSPLGEITETKNGRKLQRCSKGFWNPETKKTEGCVFVKWFPIEPEVLEEKCPKCGSVLVLQVTRFGKRMKKCSAGGWDKEAKKATGCDFVEWINGTTEKLDEKCPECGELLVLFTTNSGKKMKKCSTAGWDREKKEATGCTYVEWLKSDFVQKNNGEEFLPPDPNS